MYKRSWLVLLAATISLIAAGAFCQDAPSLGDVARQARQKKDQAKSATSNDPKAKVITNEEIPESAQSASSTEKGNEHSSAVPGEFKQSPDQWKSQILTEKNQIASLQGHIQQLNDSIRFAPANCVSNCVAWNERQRQKQEEADRMQAQLDDEKKHLEEMQDTARKQGYGSSVYDP
jgi:hypothetical protein